MLFLFGCWNKHVGTLAVIIGLKWGIWEIAGLQIRMIKCDGIGIGVLGGDDCDLNR